MALTEEEQNRLDAALRLRENKIRRDYVESQAVLRDQAKLDQLKRTQNLQADYAKSVVEAKEAVSFKSIAKETVKGMPREAFQGTNRFLAGTAMGVSNSVRGLFQQSVVERQETGQKFRDFLFRDSSKKEVEPRAWQETIENKDVIHKPTTKTGKFLFGEEDFGTVTTQMSSYFNNTGNGGRVLKWTKEAFIEEPGKIAAGTGAHFGKILAQTVGGLYMVGKYGRNSEEQAEFNKRLDEIRLTPDSAIMAFMTGEESFGTVPQQGEKFLTEVGADEDFAKKYGATMGYAFAILEFSDFGLPSTKGVKTLGKSKITKNAIAGFMKMYKNEGIKVTKEIRKATEQAAEVIAKDKNLAGKVAEDVARLVSDVQKSKGLPGVTSKQILDNLNLKKVVTEVPAKKITKDILTATTKKSVVKTAVNTSLDAPLTEQRIIAEAAELGVVIPEFTTTRGTVTFAESLDAAIALGYDQNTVLNFPVGKVLNDQEVLATIGVIKQAQNNMNVLAKEASTLKTAGDKTGSLDALAKLADNKVTYYKLVDKYRGVTAEMGRAFNILKNPGYAIDPTYARFKSFLNNPNTTAGQKQYVLDKLAKFDGDSTEIADLLDKLTEGTKWEMFIEWTIASLLWSPATHLRNIIGTTANIVLGLPQRFFAGLIDSGLHTFLGKPRERFVSDVQNEINGWRLSWDSAGSEMRLAWRDENHALKKKLTQDVVAGGQKIKGRLYRDPKGKYYKPLKAFDKSLDFVGPKIRGSFRALGVEDSVLRTYAEHGALHTLIGREASKKFKYGSKEYIDEFARLIEEPSADLLKKSREEADMLLFQKDIPGKWAGIITKMRNEVPTTKVAIPFFRTPVNIFLRSLDFTPLGLLKKDSGFVKGGFKNPAMSGERIDSMANVITGAVAATIAFIPMRQEGNIVLEAPLDPDERDAFWRQHPPYSIKVGEKWIPFNTLSPVADIIINSAIMADAMDDMKDPEGELPEKLTNAMSRVMLGTYNNMKDKTFLEGVDKIMTLIMNPDVEGKEGEKDAALSDRAKKTMAELAMMPIPSFIPLTARAIDPTIRETASLKDMFYSKIPGLSDNLHPRTNVYGEPLVRGGNVVKRLIYPSIGIPVNNDVLDLEMERAEYVYSFPQRRAYNEDLSDEEYYAIREVSGKMFYTMATKVVTTETFQKLNITEKQQAFKEMSALVKKTVKDTLVPGKEVNSEVRETLRNMGLSESEAESLMPKALEALGLEK